VQQIYEILGPYVLGQTGEAPRICENVIFGPLCPDRRREGASTIYWIADQAVVELCRTACVRIAGMAEDQAVPSKTLRRFMPQG
jgi:hypothetical protein